MCPQPGKILTFPLLTPGELRDAPVDVSEKRLVDVAGRLDRDDKPGTPFAQLVQRPLKRRDLFLPVIACLLVSHADVMTKKVVARRYQAVEATPDAHLVLGPQQGVRIGLVGQARSLPDRDQLTEPPAPSHEAGVATTT